MEGRALTAEGSPAGPGARPRRAIVTDVPNHGSRAPMDEVLLERQVSPIADLVHRTHRCIAYVHHRDMDAKVASNVRRHFPEALAVAQGGEGTIVAMGILAASIPVILKTEEGLHEVRRVLIDVGRGLRLTRAQLFWKIQFPAAVPAIFTGIRLGLVFALINVVGIEFLINFGGLGQLINELAERYDLAGTYAAIGFVILISVVFFIATERAERWLTSADS